MKQTTNFNDSFFRIKVYTPNFNHPKFAKVFEKEILEVKTVHIVDVPNGIIKLLFSI